MVEEINRVGILRTQARKLFSQQTGVEYQLAVWLPESYASSGKQYPVIYVLDGDSLFGMATVLSRVDDDHEMIIVGIGYNRSVAEWGALREKDFKIPEVQADPPDSRADRFLAALKEEFIVSSQKIGGTVGKGERPAQV
jgi:predicted alpha/beta superfamily hydrolase